MNIIWAKSLKPNNMQHSASSRYNTWWRKYDEHRNPKKQKIFFFVKNVCIWCQLLTKVVQTFFLNRCKTQTFCFAFILLFCILKLPCGCCLLSYRKCRCFSITVSVSKYFLFFFLFNTKGDYSDKCAEIFVGGSPLFPNAI